MTIVVQELTRSAEEGLGQGEPKVLLLAGEPKPCCGHGAADLNCVSGHTKVWIGHLRLDDDIIVTGHYS